MFFLSIQEHEALENEKLVNQEKKKAEVFQWYHGAYTILDACWTLIARLSPPGEHE